MAKNATASQLIHAFESHLKETEVHVTRLEKIVEFLGLIAVSKKFDAMAELLEKDEGIIKETKVADIRNAATVSAAQKVKHYEIASYEILHGYTVILGKTKADLHPTKTREE